jgi:hypothetical protein
MTLGCCGSHRTTSEVFRALGRTNILKVSNGPIWNKRIHLGAYTVSLAEVLMNLIANRSPRCSGAGSFRPVFADIFKMLH